MDFDSDCFSVLYFPDRSTNSFELCCPIACWIAVVLSVGSGPVVNAHQLYHVSIQNRVYRPTPSLMSRWDSGAIYWADFQRTTMYAYPKPGSNQNPKLWRHLCHFITVGTVSEHITRMQMFSQLSSNLFVIWFVKFIIDAMKEAYFKITNIKADNCRNIQTRIQAVHTPTSHDVDCQTIKCSMKWNLP